MTVRSKGHSRAISTLHGNVTTSKLNSPFEKGLATQKFYSPRIQEQHHQNNLIYNNFQYHAKEMMVKYNKGQLPDKWMDMIRDEEQMRTSVQSMGRRKHFDIQNLDTEGENNSTNLISNLGETVENMYKGFIDTAK